MIFAEFEVFEFFCGVFEVFVFEVFAHFFGVGILCFEHFEACFFEHLFILSVLKGVDGLLYFLLDSGDVAEGFTFVVGFLEFFDPLADGVWIDGFFFFV